MKLRHMRQTTDASLSVSCPQTHWRRQASWMRW